ncbi:MAG: hypothetical protein KKB31_05260 [Nanoarchaeota archaeon]|nr:hypothetical protein [Nanoarchaeota archaeon]
MNKIQFDSTGKPVMPESVKQDLEKEKDSVVLTKIQVRLNNPAIAQLKIVDGENLQNPQSILSEIKNYCNSFIDSRYSSVDTSIMSREGALIVESRASWKMYSFFEALVKELKSRIKNLNVVVRGSWEGSRDHYL